MVWPTGSGIEPFLDQRGGHGADIHLEIAGEAIEAGSQVPEVDFGKAGGGFRVDHLIGHLLDVFFDEGGGIAPVEKFDDFFEGRVGGQQFFCGDVFGHGNIEGQGKGTELVDGLDVDGTVGGVESKGLEFAFGEIAGDGLGPKFCDFEVGEAATDAFLTVVVDERILGVLDAVDRVGARINLEQDIFVFDEQRLFPAGFWLWDHWEIVPKMAPKVKEVKKRQ